MTSKCVVSATHLPVEVLRFWAVRQIFGADPKVPAKVARNAMYAALKLSVPEDDLRRMFEEEPRQRRMTEAQMMTFLEKLEDEAKLQEAGLAKSSWTVGRKNPRIQLDYFRSLEQFLRQHEGEAGDEPHADVAELQANVHGIGPWGQFSIMHHVLRLNYMVPGDSRVKKNALRCSYIGENLGDEASAPEVDDFLIRRFGKPCGSGQTPTGRRCKKRKGNCRDCLFMTERLREWYATLNRENVTTSELDSLWERCHDGDNGGDGGGVSVASHLKKKRRVNM